MSADLLEAALAELETALERRPANYKAVIEAIRTLPKLSGTEPVPVLRRSFGLCYRMLGCSRAGAPMRLAKDAPAWQYQHLRACAISIVEDAIHAPDVLSADAVRIREPTPAALTISHKDASDLLSPYLEGLALTCERKPSAIVRFAYKMLRAGHAPFRGLVEDWLQTMETDRRIPAGTQDAIFDAILVEDLAADDLDVCWERHGPRMVAALDDTHAIRVAAAGRWLGLHYAVGTHLDGAPLFGDLVERLRQVKHHRATAAGAFISGLDVDCTGLKALFCDPRLPKTFDEKPFVLDVLAAGPEDDVPIAQAFWFYLHEHYDFDGEFVAHLYAKGHAFVALMCATEQCAAVPGMRPVLSRLATDADPEIAGPAADHLKTYYRR